MTAPYRVGLSRDLRAPSGAPRFGGARLTALAEHGVEWAFIAEDVEELTPALVAPFDAIMLFGRNAVTSLLPDKVTRLRHIARLGVGLDAVDVDACTRAGIVVTTTPDAVRGPMAGGALAMLLSLAFALPEKDALARSGAWDARLEVQGPGLAGSAVGIVGLGNIGAELARMLGPLDVEIIATGPRLTHERAAAVGARYVSFERLLQTADYVCLTCSLRSETRGLLSREQIALMRPGACIVNVSRGPVVDQRALADALLSGHLRAAALDVFDPEPPADDDPMLHLGNVLLAPHSVGFTPELFDAQMRSACDAVLEVVSGTAPANAVNRPGGDGVTP